MTFGTAAGRYALGYDPRPRVAQVIPAFASAIQRPDAGVVVAVELKVAEIATPSVTITKYLSTQGFCTLPTDSPSNIPVEGRITACVVSREIGQGSQSYTADPEGQRSRAEDRFVLLTNGLATAGAVIELANNDGTLDSWPDDYYVDGRQVTIKLGALDDDRRVGAYGDFATVYVGEAGPWERGVNSLRINVSSIGARLKTAIGTLTYAGSGGSQGPEELAGVSRPQAYGRAYNVEAQPTDDVRAILQLHDSAMQEVLALRDKGVALTYTGVDYATYGELNAATTGEDESDIPVGSYATCLASGFVKLGAAPAGMVTADVWGDIAANQHAAQEPWDDGTYWDDGYGWSAVSLTLPVDTVAGIIFRIEGDRAGLTPSDINDSAFAAYDAVQPAQCGYAVPAGDGRTVLDAEAEVALSDHAFVYPDQFGRRAIRRLAAPEGSSPYNIDDLSLDDIEMVDLPYGVPPYNWRVWYARNWRQQTTDELAAIVSTTQRIVRRRYGRIRSGTDTAIQAAHKTNRSAEFFTFFEDQAEADALIQRLFAFYALGRKMWRAVVRGQLFRVELGDTVKLTSSRFDGLAAGRYCVALSVTEDPVAQTTTLLLFG